MNNDETQFYTELGLPRELIQKSLKNRTVLDMPKILEAIKEAAGDKSKITPIFQESPEEAKERSKLRRLNAFRMRHLESLITSTFIEEYDARGLFDRIEIRRDVAERILAWTPEKPFKVEGTNRARAYYLSGHSGAGKSTLMQMHAIRLYDAMNESEKIKGNLIKYISLSEFFTKYYSTKEEHVKAELEYAFAFTRFLFIDDIGAEKFSEGKEDMLKNLLQRRMEADPDKKTKWTFFSSNYDIETLPYNQTVIRRVKDLVREIKIGPTFLNKQSFDANSNFSHS